MAAIRSFLPGVARAPESRAAARRSAGPRQAQQIRGFRRVAQIAGATSGERANHDEILARGGDRGGMKRGAPSQCAARPAAHSVNSRQ